MTATLPNSTGPTRTQGEKATNSGEEDSIPEVRPIKYGSASPPDINQQQSIGFEGRGGVWHCENCDKATLLPSKTKQWTCRGCKKTMYTLPADECPLDTFCPCCCWDTILSRN